LYAQRVEDLALSKCNASVSGKPGSIRWHKVPSLPGPHVAQFLAWILMNGFMRKWHAFFRKLSYDFVLSPGINSFHADVVIVHAIFHRLKLLSDEKTASGASEVSFSRRFHRHIYYTLLSWMERRMYADPKVSIAAVSIREAGLITEYFGRGDVHVIPNGVDSAYFSPATRLARRVEARTHWGFGNEDFVLLLIGNDLGTKGLQTVLHALSILQSLPIRILVVGGDDNSFRDYAKQCGVQDRCHWQAPSANVLDFYGAADLYVSPSREDSFGLPVAEAMACGLPVITSVFAGVSSFIEDGVDGFVLSDPRDPHPLAKIVCMLYEQTDLRDRVGGAAAKKAIEFSWDRNAAQVWQLLTDRAEQAYVGQA
jgi:UDP-glucose:(heptosyl)LPS alpha-1,3-glucosyltransferase